MRLLITKSADRELRRAGPAANRLRDKIRQYAADPQSLRNNVTALKNSDALRLRVGDHRVIFEIREDTMVVLRVRKRDEAYD